MQPAHARAKRPYDGPNPRLRPFPPPMSWLQDGVDHINIGHGVATELGKTLAIGSNLSVNHSIFGKFCNVESFSYYIQSVERDDRLRRLYGLKLVKAASRLTLIKPVNYNAMVLDTMYQRIFQNKALYTLVKESTLPFEHYYINKASIRVRPNHFDWFIRGMEEIRRAIKSDTAPDFFYFKDNSIKDIYDYAHEHQVQGRNQETVN